MYTVIISEPFTFATTPWHTALAVQIIPDGWQRCADFMAALRHADALIVRNQTRVDAGLLAAAPRLRAIGRLGIGLDNIDLEACANANVRIVYAPDSNARAVAEYCLAQMLNLLRLYPAAYANCAAGQWDRFRFIGCELHQQTVGLIGFGRSARLLATMLEAFGARVRVYARKPENVPSTYQTMALEELLQSCSILSLHVPATPDTTHLMNAARLALMPKGSYLINAGRGALIDEAALAEALCSGHVAGAALDVRAQEPPPLPNPLQDCPNLLLTPHIAGFSIEAEDHINTCVLNDVQAILDGQEPRYPVPTALSQSAA